MSLRHLLPSAFLLAAMSPSVMSQAVADPRAIEILNATRPSNVIVLAHRACWEVAPENSVAAIKACKAMGADAIEIDVRRSRDGKLFVMHDESVDRTTNGTGAIAELTAAEISGLRLRRRAGGPGAALTDQHVPTVEEALRAARGKVIVNLHLKVAADAEVADLVKRLKMVGKVTTWVTESADDSALTNSPLRGAIGIIPTINDCTLGYPAPCWPAQINSLESYAPIRPVAFFLDYRQTHEFIQQISNVTRPAGTRIFVETLNTVDRLPQDQRRAEWRWLVDSGVSIIMTNEPRDLIEFLQSVSLKR